MLYISCNPATLQPCCNPPTQLQPCDQVLYISCNPATLRENLRASGLEGTHAVRKFALFDHFPYTPHLECGVWLARRCKET